MKDSSSDDGAFTTAGGEQARMMTRRSAIGSGVACALVACASSFGANAAIASQRRPPRSIDALLIDDDIALPRPMAAFVETNRRNLPVVAIQLDARGQAVLTRILDASRTLVGLSSGATLFCVERIAWDHGYRMVARRQRCAAGPDADACCQDMSAYVSGAQAFAASADISAGDYRPSRADGTLHSWLMQKSRPQYIRNRRET
jgi:hypothetical protein